jgi:transposase
MPKNGKAKKRIFGAEYKAEVVRLCDQPRKGPCSVARDLGLTPSAVAGWVRKAKVDASGAGAGALTTAEREELSTCGCPIESNSTVVAEPMSSRST